MEPCEKCGSADVRVIKTPEQNDPEAHIWSLVKCDQCGETWDERL